MAGEGEASSDGQRRSPMGEHHQSRSPPELRRRSSQVLSSLGLLELLEHDQRPTCIVDLGEGETPHICYHNARFAGKYDFEVPGQSGKLETESVYFRNWALSRAKEGGAAANFHGLSWIATTLRKRWKIVQASSVPSEGGSEDSEDSDSHRDLRHAGVLRNLPKGSAEAHHQWLRGLMLTGSQHDWTAMRSPRKTTDHVALLRGWDWSLTPLGPMEHWSPRLKMMVNLIVVDPNPAVLFWGPELVGVYNDLYVPFLHDKHPKSLGQPYHRTWAELYRQEAVAKMVDEIWTKCVHGQPISMERQPFYLRNGKRLQEHIFNLSFLPVFDEDGRTIAFYESIKEVTMDHINERRASSVRLFGELSAREEDLGVFYRKVIDALEPNEQDVPFAMLYSLKSASIDWERPFKLNFALSAGLVKLESYIGVHSVNGQPVVHDLLMQDDEFLDAFEQVCKSGEIDTLDLESRSSIARSIMEEPPTRAFGDQTRLAVLIPIAPIASKNVNAVLLVGVNPRRPYDAEYESWIQSLARSISSSLASLVLLNEQRQAVGQALEMEKRAMSMLEHSPVGASLCDLMGNILYVNRSWREITGYPHKDFWEFSFMDVIADDFKDTIMQEWKRVVEGRLQRTFIVALKKPWVYVDPVTLEEVTDRSYIIVQALVQRIGESNYVTSAVTDISHQKWMESLQRKRRQEAMDMKRQQENFMDMTSHEMRNPLSAIFQCADAIINSLSAFHGDGQSMAPELSPKKLHQWQSSHKPQVPISEAIAYAIENAGTITLCAQHQKRIVDDVLVLSKVDANLIEVHPVDVQPRVLIENAIKMFAAELAANQAKMTLDIESSFDEHSVDWVKLDPGRVLQILINLCTNAIKFSMDSRSREISIVMGASAEIPTSSTRGVRYLHGVADEGFVDPTSRVEWGSGQVLYLSFQVSDTGRGMTEEEMKMLFQRFSQASPRTHTQYGGSGLGLFIARLLSRLQGGEIGVTSTTGEGSTFAFYVKVRRAETPHGTNLHTVVPEVNIPVGIHSATSPPPDPSTLKNASDIKILIVEDNLVNQKVLSRQLRSQGFYVSIANNGVEALEFIQRTVFWRPNKNQGQALSIILMDIEMPVMNGIEATRRIREFEEQGLLMGHVPIIAITANARSEQITVAREAGMDEVVSKPFRIPELLAKIESFVGQLVTEA